MRSFGSFVCAASGSQYAKMRVDYSKTAAIDAVTRCLPLWPIVNQPGFDQNLQMLRDGGLGKIKPPDNILAAAGILDDQLAQDRKPHRMTKCRINARSLRIIQRNTG